MKKNYTDINIVLDRSGSMASVQHDIIGGFNRFVGDQKEVPGEATVTLNQFDDIFERVHSNKPIQQIPDLDSKTFVPRGSTALLDAIGKTIEETGKRIGELPEEQRPEKVVVVILTDGFENASRQFTSGKISEMISHQRDVYKWEFVFIGANQDAIATASKMGIDASNSLTYANNAQGTAKAFASLSSNMRLYRTEDSLTMAFCAQDKKDQQDAGV